MPIKISVIVFLIIYVNVFFFPTKTNSVFAGLWKTILPRVIPRSPGRSSVLPFPFRLYCKCSKISIYSIIQSRNSYFCLLSVKVNARVLTFVRRDAKSQLKERVGKVPGRKTWFSGSVRRRNPREYKLQYSHDGKWKSGRDKNRAFGPCVSFKLEKLQSTLVCSEMVGSGSGGWVVCCGDGVVGY